ncbi:MAG: T9SS type A sorting domain-containing protein [Bacteroidota bacterium]
MYNYKVLDISGRVLSQKSITNIQGSVEFNTSSFRDGLYFVQLYSGNLIQSVTKVIINH